jgi:hypothetical protein
MRAVLICALVVACSSSNSSQLGDDVPVDAPTSDPDGGDTTYVDPAWPADVPLESAIDFPPYANLLDATTVVISWRTTAATTGVVRYGTTAAKGSEATSTTAGNLHHVTLSGLTAGAAYYYEVAITGTSVVRQGVFVLPGRPTWRLMHAGEFHAPSESSNVAKFASAIREFRPHVVLESGDMVDDGNVFAQWRDYVRTSAPWIGNVLLLPSHSNHVNGPGGNANLEELFVLPDTERWYTTRYGQVEFFTVDSTYAYPEVMTDEVPWLAGRAAAAHDGVDDPTFVVAAWHYPACSSQYLSRAPDRSWVQDNLVATLVANGGVDLILAAHDKYYERSTITGGIVHVITNLGYISPEIAGGNHPACTAEKTSRSHQSVGLFTVDGRTLAMRALDETGAELDVVTITR